MLKEKREKGATTPSSPHDATPPATPPTVKEERKEDEGVTPSPKQPATPKQPQKQEEDDLDKVAPPPDAEATEAPPFSGGGGGSIQPLVSNLMGKQSGGGLEYMQQSSQIFVFSTTLANKGAESVLSGHFPSIIAYHCAQPGTKKILEKHPLKLGQFNRHAPWSLMGAFSQKPRGGGTKAPAGAMLDPQDTDADTDGWPSEPLKSELTDEMANGGAGVSPAAASLVQGVKVPDENLTPQQRQHREEQLAMIRKMHLMLFPEQSDADAATMQDVEEKLANEMANRQMAHMADFLPCPTPMAAPGYKGGGGADWTRLQHHYCEERKGGRAAPQRAHGPPPPYHQTPRSASVPIATHSPSPNSPQNLTSTLSLPSPRGGGGGGALASPSDSRHAPMRHLSAGQSPASAGSPAALSRPLAQSSPATPQSAHLSPCGGGGFKDVDLPPPDDKAPPPPSSPARTPSRGDGGALKVEHAPSPGIQCSPASQTPHDKAPPTFFADISPEAGGNAEHVSMGGGGGGGGGSFSLPDDNMPLNPDTSVAPETTKVMPFDPISSLAQMSQQLTNTTPPFNGAPPGGPNGAVMAAQISTCSYGQEMASQQQQQEEMLECAQLHGMMVSASDMVGLHSAPYGKILPPTAGKPLSPKMVTGGVHGVGGFGGGQMARMGSPAGRLCPPASLADSYNGGASVQVRASAPNTIQYLPARPQLCPQMPRPPPSLDFLQRFANPMHNGGDRGRHDVMNGVFHEHPGGGGGMFQGGGGPPLRHAPPFHSPDKLMEPPPPTSQSYVGGPTTTDPNYAQQFHNFQQQLYATTTRISTTQGGAPPQTYFINK